MDSEQEYEWDDAKAARNLAEHEVSLQAIRLLDWETCFTFEDDRRSYGEQRLVTYGLIGERLHVAVWTWRGGKRRIISLRKANGREIDRYERRL